MTRGVSVVHLVPAEKAEEPVILYSSAAGGVFYPCCISRADPEEDRRPATENRVKNIIAEWRNLAEGLLRVEALEAQIRAEWGPWLENARKERQEAERQRRRKLRRAAVIVALVLALVLLAAALVLRFSLDDAFAFGLLLAGPSVAILYGLSEFFGAPNPAPDPSDLSGRWWGTISGRTSSVRRSGPALSARHYGDVGEESFVSYLTGRLSEEYVAVRGPLVVRNLDADVIIFGPTGIWGSMRSSTGAGRLAVSVESGAG